MTIHIYENRDSPTVEVIENILAKCPEDLLHQVACNYANVDFVTSFNFWVESTPSHIQGKSSLTSPIKITFELPNQTSFTGSLFLKYIIPKHRAVEPKHRLLILKGISVPALYGAMNLPDNHEVLFMENIKDNARRPETIFELDSLIAALADVNVLELNEGEHDTGYQYSLDKWSGFLDKIWNEPDENEWADKLGQVWSLGLGESASDSLKEVLQSSSLAQTKRYLKYIIREWIPRHPRPELGITHGDFHQQQIAWRKTPSRAVLLDHDSFAFSMRYIDIARLINIMERSFSRTIITTGEEIAKKYIAEIEKRKRVKIDLPEFRKELSATLTVKELELMNDPNRISERHVQKKHYFILMKKLTNSAKHWES